MASRTLDRRTSAALSSRFASTSVRRLGIPGDVLSTAEDPLPVLSASMNCDAGGTLMVRLAPECLAGDILGPSSRGPDWKRLCGLAPVASMLGWVRGASAPSLPIPPEAPGESGPRGEIGDKAGKGGKQILGGGNGGGRGPLLRMDERDDSRLRTGCSDAGDGSW